MDLTSGLHRRGHQIHVVARPHSTLLPKLNFLARGNVHVLPLRNALDVQSANALARLIGRHDIQIIHAHMARDYSLAAYATRRNPRARFIITRHVLFPMNRLHRRIFTRASRIIAVSEAVCGQLRKQNLVEPQKITIVKNGVDIAHLNEIRSKSDRSELLQSWGFSDDSLIVATVGELNRLKGHDLFVRAAALVIDKFPSARFLVVGGDPSQKKEIETSLREMIGELRLQDRVRLLGEVDEIGSVLAGVDVFVSASRTESFGLAIVEAMAGGIPVIATATEGARELIRDPEVGLIVPVDQVAEMAAAILKLLRDPDMRSRMGQRASREVAEHFHIERMIDDVEQIYRESLDNSQ